MKRSQPIILAVFCQLITLIGTSTTDVNSLNDAHSTQSQVLQTSTTGPIITTTLKLTTLDPKEAARLATLELSKQIFRNITKQLRDSIAAKNFSVFSTSPPVEEDEFHPFRHQPKHHHEHHWGPYFDEPLSGNGALQVKAHLASEAVLNCRVGMLRDKTVMWLRRMEDKVHLLTVGATTYSGDARVAVKFQYPNNWRLSINPVQREDAGLYMCQVSTHPPRVLLTNVTVLAPILKIVDEQGHEVKDRYYKTGSSIELSCRVSRAFSGNFNSITTTAQPKFTIKPFITTTTSTTTTSTTASNTNSITHRPNITLLMEGFKIPEVISFYSNAKSNNNNHINESSDTSKNTNLNSTQSSSNASESGLTLGIGQNNSENNVFGITWYKDGKLLTDKIINRNMSSTFKQKLAEQKDAGSYSCSILNTSTVTVTVHVLSGETQAAVQHDTLNKAEQRLYSTLCLIFTLFLSRCICMVN